VTAVEVSLLGRLVIEVDGKRADDARLGDLGRKAFAYLVLERRRPVPRDELADVLWGEDLPPTWTAALRGVLSRLRATLADAGLAGPDLLSSRGGCYQLHLPDDAVVDVERVEAALASVSQDLAAAPDRARRAAAEVADLAGCRFLPGAGGEWVEGRQAELATLRVRALELLAEAAAAGAEFGVAAAAAEQAIALAPLRESAHQRLMAAHAGAGNRAAALRAYEACRSVLAEELGVSPSPETYDLYVRLLRDEPPAEAAAARAVGNLPPERTSFIGRQGDIDELRRLLGSTRLVTLTGPGGVGKSRLAVRVAESLVEDHPDGVWLVELAGLADPVLVPQQVLSVLSLPEASSSPTDAVAGHLAGRSLLLVLDNCEHLVDACAALADAVLRNSPAVRIIATSREPLGVPGETTWPVPPLPAMGPDDETGPDALLGNEAARLFADRARAVAPDLDLRPAAADVALICARLEGIPLAIELAAARTKVLSPAQIAGRLGDHLALLVGGPRLAPGRHQTLRAAIDWSFEALSPQEGSLFARLSVFAGGWSLDAAEAVYGDTADEGDILESLAALVDKSLVTVDRRGPRPRYRMLETLRQYAAGRLAEAGETPAIRTRHLAWAVTLAETGAAKLQGDDQAAWLEMLDEEHDNLRAAMDWAEEEHRVQEGLRLAAALVRFWEIRGYLRQGRDRLEGFAAEPGGPAAIRAKALNAAAVLAQRQGDVAGARRSYQEALVVQRARGDRVGVATALHGLANLAVNDGDLVTARALFDENLGIARELGAAQMEAASLMNLGVVAHAAFMRGHRDVADAGPDAHHFYREALAAYEALGDGYGQALALENLGTLTRLFPGDWKGARRLHEDSLAIRRALGDRLGIADSARYIALLAMGTGEVGTARQLHEERLVIERELDNAAHVAEAVTDLGEIALLDGRLTDASTYLDEARAIYEAFDDRESLVRVLTDLGELARRRGDHARSRSYLERCLVLADELDSRYGKAWALTQLARLARAEGDSRGSLARAREALAIAAEYRLTGVEAAVLDVAGAVAADQGDLATALRLSAAAEALRISSRRLLEVEHTVDHDVALLALGRAGYDQARAEGAAMTAEARRQLARAVQVG
jgi:predicted ATPase/DNA-binding SARP family transcriptional activator